MQLVLDLGGDVAQGIGAARIVLGHIAAIFRVADNRVANGFRMGAQLVGAASDGLHRQPRQARRELVDRGVIGDRMLGVDFAMFGDAHFFGINPLAGGALAHRLAPRRAVVAHRCALGQKQRNAALRRAWNALHHRPINLAGLTRAENLAKISRHLAGFSDQQHAGRVAIKPMHQHRALAHFLGHALQNAVDMARGARAALHGQPIGLVQHHQLAVFKQRDLADQLHVLRAGFRRALDGGRLHLQLHRRHAHQRASLQPVGALNPLAVHAHFALAANLVEVRQAHQRKTPTEPAVEPHAVLVLAHGQRLHRAALRAAGLLGGCFCRFKFCRFAGFGRLSGVHERPRTKKRAAPSARMEPATEAAT